MEATQLGSVMLPHLNQRSTFRNRTGKLLLSFDLTQTLLT